MGKKHKWFLGVTLFALVFVGAGVSVSANSGVTGVENYIKSESKVSLSINQSGGVQFSGAKFVSLSGSSVNITVSGLPLTLSTDSNTQISGVASLSNMVAGDVLSGKGNINSSTGVITALSIRDESQQTQRIADLENQIKSLLEQLKKLQSEFKSLR